MAMPVTISSTAAGGIDLMVGGAGNDTYFVDDASDACFEGSPTRATTRCSRSGHYGLAADVETLVLQGSGDFQGYGNNQANTLYGNVGNNLLNGAGRRRHHARGCRQRYLFCR